MVKQVDFLLVGGGLASATAAETLREEGAEGTILIVSAEDALPYQRPPLSTEFLLGTQSEDRLLILSQDFYREHEVEITLGTRALAVDSDNRIVQTEVGEIRYGKLLIATGATPTRLEIPGSALPGIFYLRTVLDAQRIRHAAETASRAVVVGGSFLGMELAASLTERGVHVTLIAMEDVLLSKLESPIVSEFFCQYYAARGVEIILADAVIEFRGKRRVETVITRSGRTFPCDLVVVGIGVVPNVDFLQGSNVKVNDGILVNRFLQTNDPNIFAAGDVANFFDPVFNLRRRIEHWDNAVKQGRLAAKNMLGQMLSYDEVSYFFCDVFDISFDFMGVPDEAEEQIARGSMNSGSFALFYLRNNVPRALFSMGRPAQETRATEALIRYRVNLQARKGQLSDPEFPLEKVPTQTVLILQGGGALGAFECGVVRAMEERGIYPDIVAGVSMGAFNGAIIAGNPGNANAALDAFWKELEVQALYVPNESWRRMFSSWSSVILGSPKFFRPLWFTPIFGIAQLPFLWTSLYDPSPVKDLLAKYVDFDRLKTSAVRLLVSAVNVETAELEIFDSYVDDLTPDHILASGSLPPGFPWTTINGKHYWDGGIVSNSPLEQVAERCGTAGKRVFIVDLYPNRKKLPADLMEVMVRRDEIVYSERIRNDARTQALIREFHKLVEELVGEMPLEKIVQIKQRPRYVQLIGDVAPMTITRIVREVSEDEPVSKDYDFSHLSIEEHKQQGYELTNLVLGPAYARIGLEGDS
jgi:NADPH-dependent 2,4-dienoyl-CoA reductase/sulfur reductase-like enzyme/predicted acylesterase/phospholipase RssA